MSIFEPIPRESHSDHDAPEFDDTLPDVGATPPGGSLDPRSITIAGLVVAGIVVTGLVVSNSARPEPQPRPLVASRADPGAAAVEQAEVRPTAPTAGPSAEASVEPVDEAASTDSDDSWSGWRQPEDSSDDSWSGGSKRDDKRGRGHGRGNR